VAIDQPTCRSVQRLCDHLARAVERGVDVTLILESEDESESLDAVSAFARLPIDRTHVYYWPLESRERNQAGKPGKLNAKCAIIVDTAVIGSANMTDDAFNRNIEMGVIVREQSTVADLVERFDELVRRRILISYMPVRNESSALARLHKTS